MRRELDRPDAEALLAEYGERARLVVFLAAALGAGKTRRLLEEIRRLRAAGRDAVIGWIETKGRPDLEALARDIPQIPPLAVQRNGQTFTDFDFDAAIARKPKALALDEVAHENMPGAKHRTRWEEALALRDAGITVLCGFNIAHLESVAPAAERLIGHPLSSLVPDRFLRAADEVVALDVSPQLLRSRLRSGKVVRPADVDTALSNVFSERTLYGLRELLLHTVDEMTLPHVSAERVSTAVAFVPPGIPIESYVERAASVARAVDLLMEVRAAGAVDHAELERAAERSGAELLSDPFDIGKLDLSELRASLVIVPKSQGARRLVNHRLDRDVFIIDPTQTYLSDRPFRTYPLDTTAGDRFRIGYGKLTVYLGAVAGSGKTYAMLDRAHQLRAEGVDVVGGFIEAHGRKETDAMIGDLEVLPRRVILKEGVRYEELDRDAVLARRPQVVLIDELAHTNAPGSFAKKRYEDVLAILRAGIGVITTLNIQHLEALNDTVDRMTQTQVRETLPDGLLALADEVILIDVTPQTLRQRLREGKIYPPDRIERALSSFFTLDNLASLRELALREAMRARKRERPRAPFERLLLCVGPREQDVALILRCSQFAARLGADFAVAMIVEPRDACSKALTQALRDEAYKHCAEWIEEIAPDPARRIIELARMVPETTVALATTLRQPRWPQRNAFARRVLDAGARELLVLTRR
jgi:two-component system, OmpR family, sensor histidine kinase KdpD